MVGNTPSLKDDSSVAGFRLRALLVHEVFDKVLFLTPSARARFTSGRVFNLVSLLAACCLCMLHMQAGFAQSLDRYVPEAVRL